MLLDVNAINKVAPYKVAIEDGDKTAILFSTDNGKIYTATFVEDKGLLDGLSAYHFSFYCSSNNATYDKSVSVTLWCIIDNFLTRNTTAIIYITDDTDNRGTARSRLFERWYNTSGIYAERYILKTIQQRAGILISRNNPLLSQYITMIENIEALLQKQ